MVAWLLIALSGATACNPVASLERFEFRERQMGVEARIVLYAPDTLTAQTSARAAFQRIADLDSILSDYRTDSELRRVSDSASFRAVPVGDDLFEILRTADSLHRETEGAFDLASGRVVQLWRQARRTGVLPTDDELREALSRSGWQHVVLDTAARTVRFTREGIRLDAGGIGKGYAADEALEQLRAHGVPRAMVSIGGDIVTADAPPGADGWVIALADSTITLTNTAVSTSGDAEQSVEIEGVRYSHVADPRTGIGLTSGVTVTIRAPRGRDADAWATAAAVLYSARRSVRCALCAVSFPSFPQSPR